MIEPNEHRHRLRARVGIVVANGRILLQLGERVSRLQPADEPEIAFLEALRIGGSKEEIRHTFEQRSEQSWERFSAHFDELLARGFLERLDLEHDLALEDVARFDRLLHFFSELETSSTNRFQMLARLRDSRVAVIGVGGMGSWVVYHLLCCGVGNLRLIDGDCVEMSNLNRSILFTEDVVGRPKVEAAAAAVRRFAPRTEIEIHDTIIEGEAQLAPLLTNVDLVIGVADQPIGLIREWVAGACMRTGVPSIQASGLRVGPFCVPGETSCWVCDWTHQVDRNPKLPEAQRQQRSLPRGSTGALSPVASIGAGFIGFEALFYLSGQLRPRTWNAVWEMAPDFTARFRPVERHPACTLCGASSR